LCHCGIGMGKSATLADSVVQPANRSPSRRMTYG